MANAESLYTPYNAYNEHLPIVPQQNMTTNNIVKTPSHCKTHCIDKCCIDCCVDRCCIECIFNNMIKCKCLSNICNAKCHICVNYDSNLKRQVACIEFPCCCNITCCGCC